jgi:hypothetical protein
MDIESTELETKAGIPAAAPADAVVTHSEMMRAFEPFKEARFALWPGVEPRRVGSQGKDASHLCRLK